MRSVADAEQHFLELVAAAKAGTPQIFSDEDGVYELVYRKREDKDRLGKFLARGGPMED